MVIQDSSVRVIDYFAAGYGRPKIDADQAIFGVGASYDGGFIYANFSRGLVSDDDHDLSIDQCVYFLFPVSGGDLEGGKNHPSAQFASSVLQQFASKIKRIFEFFIYVGIVYFPLILLSVISRCIQRGFL